MFENDLDLLKTFYPNFLFHVLDYSKTDLCH